MRLPELLTQLGILDAETRERILCAAEAERLAAVQLYESDLLVHLTGFIVERREQSEGDKAMTYDPGNPGIGEQHSHAGVAHASAEARECLPDPEHASDSFDATPRTMPDACERFIDMAAAGRLPDSSHGEKAATHLATHLLAFGPRLDAEAVDGLCDFARLVKTWPQTLREMIAEAAR